MSKRNPTCGCGEQGLCNTVVVECHPCCRCIPLRLCATLEAYGCDCDGRSAFMELDENDEYTGSISCGGETLDIRVLLHHEDDRCYWRVISEEFYIDELFEIGPGGQSCEDPHLEIEAPFDGCPGTISIVQHRDEILELVSDEDGCPRPYCGACRCVCTTLCVFILENGDDAEGELEWNPDSKQWQGEVTWDYRGEQEQIVIRLERDEYTGECLAVVTGREDKYAPVVLDECGHRVEMLFEDDSSEDVLEAACQQCQCLGSTCDCPGDPPGHKLPRVMTVEWHGAIAEVDEYTTPTGANCRYTAVWDMIWRGKRYNIPDPPGHNFQDVWMSDCYDLWLRTSYPAPPPCVDGATLEDGSGTACSPDDAKIILAPWDACLPTNGFLFWFAFSTGGGMGAAGPPQPTAGYQGPTEMFCDPFELRYGTEEHPLSEGTWQWWARVTEGA